MAGTLHGDRAPIAHGRRVLQHGRAPKGADEVFCRLFIMVSSRIFLLLSVFICSLQTGPVSFSLLSCSVFSRPTKCPDYVPEVGVYLHWS